jgi:uncharacterized protein YodC (DUF2158 family)
MKKYTGLIIIVAIALAVIGFMVLKVKGVLGSGAKFKVGDYIQLKDGTGPVWKVTDVKPDMPIMSGSTTYTGAYYTQQMPVDSYVTGIEAIQTTDAKYQKVSYSGNQQGTLQLTVSPPGITAVTLTSLTSLTVYPGNWKLDPGVYLWYAEAAGYTAQSGSVEIKSGQNTPLNIALIKIAGDGGGGSNTLIQFGDGSQLCATPAALQYFRNYGPSYTVIGTC